MTEQSRPWGGTVTGDVGPYTDSQWAELQAAAMGYNADNDYGPLAGYLNELDLDPTSPASKSVVLNTGAALIQGRFYVNDADLTLAVSDNTSGQPRIDLLVLRVDYAAQTVRAVIKQGTPAASPTPPSLTQSAGVTWEIPLWQIAVANGFTTLTEGEFTDRRIFGVNQAMPSGALLLWPTDTPPVGYLLCYGQAVSRTIYARLFAAIGTTFGSGDGSTTFNLPDLRGRLPLGQDDMGGSSANRVTATEADTIGQASGAETHTLTAAQIPAHTHTVPSRYGGTDGTHISALAGNAGRQHGQHYLRLDRQRHSSQPDEPLPDLELRHQGLTHIPRNEVQYGSPEQHLRPVRCEQAVPV